MSNTSDTTPEAYAVQLDLLRRMSPQERLRKTIEWSQHLRQMAKDAIRRRHPDFDDAAVKLRFIELTYGKPLADDMRRWQREVHDGRSAE